MASTAPVADVPRQTGDPSFGGLVQIGETLVGAVKRLEKGPDYARIIASENGQRLLEAINTQARDARNGKGRAPAKKLTAEEAPAQAAAEAAAATDDVDQGPFLADVPLDLIDIGENVRVDPGELAELAASIAELGVLQPIRVIGPSHDGRYRAVWGQRRVMASIIAKKATIPALVELSAEANAPGARRSIEQLAENLQRKDLNAIEEAVAMRAVLDADPSLTQEQLATRLGRSGAWVSNTLRLLQAAPEVQEGVRTGTVTASHAKALVGLPAKDQADLVGSIKRGMSSHNLEGEIRWRAGAAEQKRKTAERTEKQIPKAIAALEAAGIAKDFQVAISHTCILENERIDAAVKKAGWKAALGTNGRGRDARCDCKAVRLEFNRKWVVELACVESRHVDRQRNVDHAADRAREQAIQAKVVELRTRIRPLVDALPLPVLLLIVAHNWSELPDLIIGKGDDDRSQLRDLVAERLASTADSRHAYAERRAPADKALDDVLAMLEPVGEPVPAAKPAKGKKAAAS